MVPLEKRRELKLLILVFQNQIRESLFRQKKTFIDVKDFTDQKEIIWYTSEIGWSIYVVFTYIKTMLRNVPRKRSCRCFVRSKGWWDIVVNSYSDGQCKYTFCMYRNMFNSLKNIWGGLQKQIVTEHPIRPEMRLSVCLCKLTRGDYHYTNRKMADIGQCTVCSINKKEHSIF